jgi:hypothetical protein
MFKPFRLYVMAFLLGLALWMPGVVTAGTEAACRFVGPGDSPSTPPAIFLFTQGDKLRVDIKVPPWRASVLYDRSTQILTVLDHVAHTYDEIGSGKRMMLRNALGLGLRVNDMRLSNGGPEQDVKLRDHLASAIKTVFNTTFHKTASNRMVGPWTADLYQGMNGKVELDAATMPQAKAMPNTEDWATWKDFLHVAFDTGKGGLVYYGADDSKLSVWPGFQGFPLGISWHEGSKVVYRFQVVSLVSKPLKADLFAPPADYKEQNVMDLLKGQ